MSPHELCEESERRGAVLSKGQGHRCVVHPLCPHALHLLILHVHQDPPERMFQDCSHELT